MMALRKCGAWYRFTFTVSPSGVCITFMRFRPLCMVSPSCSMRSGIDSMKGLRWAYLSAILIDIICLLFLLLHCFRVRVEVVVLNTDASVVCEQLVTLIFI